ncbi:late embryogenesis abundant protein [Striga asiatica]|uniref:Late embryogenesis abundant protein n=1 Tax=Striga asiatica TaxID=4170 RepID=A0A5A7QFL5_STRAF|nr:late embryogenesis abundant protein [Striga asiatica]
MPPTTSAPRPAARPRHSPLIRPILGALLSLIVLVGLAVLIAWLVVQPRKLRYTIGKGSISGYNLTRNDLLNANFQFVLRANNPNRRISLYYDKIDATVLYQDRVLSTNDVHPFYQPRRSVTHLDLYLTPKDAAVHGSVAKGLRMERAAGQIQVDLKIRAKIRMKVGVFKIHRKLKAFCGSVTVLFNSTEGFKRVDCDVDISD